MMPMLRVGFVVLKRTQKGGEIVEAIYAYHFEAISDFPCRNRDFLLRQGLFYKEYGGRAMAQRDQLSVGCVWGFPGSFNPHSQKQNERVGRRTGQGGQG
ncbi:hypothetical protein IJV57_04910 [Candidatus Saccharibacteria bacterium]|nr:hypothetical protein [Candidatus Saccharibacteria bacterium]